MTNLISVHGLGRRNSIGTAGYVQLLAQDRRRSKPKIQRITQYIRWWLHITVHARRFDIIGQNLHIFAPQNDLLKHVINMEKPRKTQRKHRFLIKNADILLEFDAEIAQIAEDAQNTHLKLHITHPIRTQNAIIPSYSPNYPMMYAYLHMRKRFFAP